MKPKEGDWVLLKDEKIIAYDNDPQKIKKILEEKNDPEIVISREISSANCFY